MDSTTLALLYGFTGLMAIVAPYLLMVFLFAGPWWTPIIGLALFVGILLQGLTMMNAPYYMQDFVKGAVLVAALVFTFYLSSRRGGRRTA